MQIIIQVLSINQQACILIHTFKKLQANFFTISTFGILFKCAFSQKASLLISLIFILKT